MPLLVEASTPHQGLARYTGMGLTLPQASFNCFSDAACFMLASRTIL